MCGLAGIAGHRGIDPEREAIVRRMTATMVHRGPDGEGYAFRDGCALGFRRLAIVDLDAPSPPFADESGSIWTVCNGEIYNAGELRKGLEGRGHRLHTRVDTEVIPHLYEESGHRMVHRLDGMFAFAVWDQSSRTLMLGRDRAGEKPLFFWDGPGEFVFASELRGLLAHPRVPRALDPVALRRYLTHGFFPAPLTPIGGIRKLPAGHVALVRDGSVRVERYWDLADHFGARREGPVSSRASIAEELDHRLRTAVRRRARSDVPVGVFLSGGLDSASVLAYQAEQIGPGVPAFSLGHEQRSFDESRFAVRAARYFDADFHALILGRADLEDGLRRVGEGLDEPLGDASTIPTHLLARFARQRVKVVLSGEGADELFAGYPTYAGHLLAERFRRLPGWLRGALRATARGLAPVSMGNVGIDYLLGRFLSGTEMGRIERHHEWFGGLSSRRHAAVIAPALLERIGADDPFGSARSGLDGKNLPDDLAELLYTDFLLYLQDDLLTKVDRATMLTSLEARAPFLDHELAEFVAALPSRLKLRGLTGKVILREAVGPRLPPEILSRRKRGFNIPFSRWVLEGLGDDLRNRFSRERIEARGLLAFDGVSALLREHMSREEDHRKPLFTLLALDLWCDRVYGIGNAVPVTGDSPSSGTAAAGCDPARGDAIMRATQDSGGRRKIHT